MNPMHKHPGKPETSTRALSDARGIFCGYVCEHCEAERRAAFRPEIFEDAGYWHDEAIEDD